MWAFGITMYEMWTAAALPYLGMNNQKVWIEVAAGYRLPQPPGCPDAVYAMMRESWDAEGRNRPSMDALAGRLRRLHADMLGEDLVGELRPFSSQYSKTSYIPPSPKPIEGIAESGGSTLDSEYQYHHLVRDATLSRQVSKSQEESAYDEADPHADARATARANDYTDSRGNPISGSRLAASAQAQDRKSAPSSTSTYIEPGVDSGSRGPALYDDADPLTPVSTYDDADPVAASGKGAGAESAYVVPGVGVAKPGQRGAAKEAPTEHGGVAPNPYSDTAEERLHDSPVSVDLVSGEFWPYVEPGKGIVSPSRRAAPVRKRTNGAGAGESVYLEPGASVSPPAKAAGEQGSNGNEAARMHGGVESNVYASERHAAAPAQRAGESAYVEPGVGIQAPTSQAGAVEAGKGDKPDADSMYVEPGVGIKAPGPGAPTNGRAQQHGNVYASDASMARGHGHGDRVLVLDDNADDDGVGKHLSRGRKDHYSVSSTV